MTGFLISKKENNLFYHYKAQTHRHGAVCLKISLRVTVVL